MFADTRSSIETICPSIERASRRETSNTPTLSPLQVSGSAAAAPTWLALAPVAPGQRARIVQEIVADAYFPVAESLPANPGPLGRTGHDRNVDAAQARNVVATAGSEAQEIGFRLQQEDRHSQEVAAGERGFANLLVQFFG